MRIGSFRVTRHLCFKNSNNLRPLDILACNSGDKCFRKDGLLAELQVGMSRGHRFLLFLKHKHDKCLVTLTAPPPPTLCVRVLK